MLTKDKIFLILLFVSLLVFSIKYIEKIQGTNFNWFKIPESKELYLLDYEKEAPKNIKFSLYSSHPITCEITACSHIDTFDLKEGVNVIYKDIYQCELNKKSLLNISCGELQNFIYIEHELIPQYKDKINFTNISISKFNGYYYIQLDGLATVKNSGYKNFDILLDNISILSPVYYFETGENIFSFKEKINIPPGYHYLRVIGIDESIDKHLVIESKAFPLDNLFLTISALFLSILIRKKYKFDILLTILIFFSIFSIYQIFQFQLSKNLNLSEWILPILTLFAIGVIYSMNNKKIATIKISNSIKFEIIIFAVIYTTIVLLLKFYIGPHDTWWPYYSRNAENTFLNGNTFFIDDLSYLGRGFTYPSVFFGFASQITELITAKSFFVIQYGLHIILVALFAITSYLMFSGLKMRRQRIVAVLIYSSLVFTFLTTVSGTLHTFSFILLNLSVIFFNLKHTVRYLTPILLSLSFATHPITIVLFLVYIYITNSFKIDIKQMFIIGILTVIISLLFYLPIFIKNGLPYEIVPQKWGYLLTFGVPGMIFDYQFLIPLIFLTIIYGIISKKYKLPSLALFSIILVNLFIAYRVNMIASVLLAGSFVAIFANYLKNKLIFILILIALISNFFISTIMYSGTQNYCTWGSVNHMCTLPMQYIRNYTSTQENLAINPEYGHLEAYLGQRKVLADLYVEYADEDKFIAENEFYQNSDISYLEKYNISIFVLDDIGKARNMLNVDRIYDNGFFHIFRKA